MALAQEETNRQIAPWMTTSSDDDENVPPEVLEEIRGAVRIAITCTSRNIFDEKLTLQEVIGIISPLNRGEAVALCAEWNRWNTWVLFHHGTWKPAEKDRQKFLDDLVPPNAQRRAMAVLEDDDFVSPFSEVSVLALIGLLCRYATDTGGESVDTRHNQRALFRALLALQDSIFPDNFLDLPVPEQFPFAVRVTLANICVQNRWAYDMGRLHALLTVPDIGHALSGMTVREWFLKRLNVDGNDYECVVNTLLGSAFYQADYSKLPQQAPALYRRMSLLLQLSTTTPEDVTHGLDKTQPQTEPSHLSDAAAHASVLLVRPMIRLGEKLICTSSRNLFNKIHRGLPYLCLEARTSPDEKKALPRIEFGLIFEAYIVWLMRQWVTGGNTRLVTNYWIPHPDGSAERDIVVINGETGYVFEVKATVPAMKIRQLGSLQDLVALHKKAADQAYTAAKALIGGEAFEDKELTRPLPQLKRVVPCAITYEFLAVRWPYSDSFENALQQSVGKPLFSGEAGILPLQILDVQQIELWDDLFKLPREIGRLLHALEMRALNPMKRYRDLPEEKRNSFRSDYVENPGIVRKMVDEAEETAGLRLKEISAEDKKRIAPNTSV